MSNISESPRPLLTYFTGLIGEVVGMIIPIFAWRSLKERCYGNQLNLENVHRHRQERSLLFASAFDNGLADRKSAFKKLNGNIRATSFLYLVNIHPIMSEFTLLKRAIFAAIRSQFYDNYLARSAKVAERAICFTDRNFYLFFFFLSFLMISRRQII